MVIRACVLAVVVSSVFVSAAKAAPLLTTAGEMFLASTLGSPSSFTFVVDKNQTSTNNFWLALEGIDGPTLVLAEAMVGDSTYLLGAFSPWQFDRNVVVPGPGRGSPGRFYVDDPAERDAQILNLTTGTTIQQTGVLAWFVDPGLGIQMGAGDLTFSASTTSNFFISGSAMATDQYATPDGLNIFGQPGRTDFSIGRLEAYAVNGPVSSVPEPSTMLLAGAGAGLGVYWRRRAKARLE
jgi:hypothetical protein